MMEIKTPYFLIDKHELEENINSFKQALNDYWPNSIFSYSVKTNSLPWLLEYMKSKNIYAEVVSDEEYVLSKMCGFDDHKIVYNGPIKTKNQIEKALYGGAIINLDSHSDLIYTLENADLVSDNVGIRVNVPTEIFEEGDVAYNTHGFRFGYSEETGGLEYVIEKLRKAGIVNFGLHFHVNSVSRSLKVYEQIANYAKKLIIKYNLQLSFIDIGGGFFGGVENKPKPNDYIRIITSVLKEVVDTEKTKLIIEPGSAIIGSCVELHSSVIDRKETDKAEIITTDASRIHIDPLWKKHQYFYRIETYGDTSKSTNKEKVICGYTCMDHDRIMVLDSNTQLTPGDKIIYEKVGAYTMTLGGPFIKYYPKVLVKDKQSTIVIREEMNVEEYYKIQRTEAYRRIENE